MGRAVKGHMTFAIVLPTGNLELHVLDDDRIACIHVKRGRGGEDCGTIEGRKFWLCAPCIERYKVPNQGGFN